MSKSNNQSGLTPGSGVVVEAKIFSLPAVSAVERTEFFALDNGDLMGVRRKSRLSVPLPNVRNDQGLKAPAPLS
jgi:hypothetical protein